MSNENQRQVELNAICDEAFQKIPSYYEDELWKKHLEWGAKRKPFEFSYKIGNSVVTTVGVSHTHEQNSPTALGIAEIFQDYSKKTDLEKRIVMVEGFHDGVVKSKSTFKESIETYGEPGAIVFLAKNNKTPVISPEIPIEKVIKILKKDFSSDEIALFYILRNLKADNTLQEIAKLMFKYGDLAECDWIPRNPDQINDIWVENLLNTGTKRLNETMNALVNENVFDLENKRLITDRKLLNTVLSPGMEAPETNLKYISQADSTERDKHLINVILENAQNKKSPLVFFGGTHILRIDPALKYIETSLS